MLNRIHGSALRVTVHVAGLSLPLLLVLIAGNAWANDSVMEPSLIPNERKMETVLTLQPSENPSPGLALIRPTGLGIAAGITAGRLLYDREDSYDTNSFAPLNLASRSVRITANVGRDGYFFRADVPMMFGERLFGVGLGSYPINYGLFLPRSRLMFFMSTGIEILRLNMFVRDESEEAYLLRARMAGGMKSFPVKGLCLSFEFAYSATAMGIDADHFSRESGGSKETFTGGLLDVHMGVEWL